MNESVTDINDENYIEDDDDKLSIVSTASLEAMGEDEERPSSSLSESSTRGSRIPRLRRSTSLKDRTQRHSDGSLLGRNSTVEYEVFSPSVVPCSSSATALVRSQSFATSRGMTGLIQTNTSFARGEVPLTPELRRRKMTEFSSTYVSPYSRKAIANERKNQSFIAGMLSREKSCMSYSRRMSLPFTTLNQKSTEESNCSVDRSCQPTVVTTHNCCGKVKNEECPVKRTNVLHCSHHFDYHDDYLTPTQRAARKIKELQAQLSQARKEIADKDRQISLMTKNFVESRLHKAENLDSEFPQAIVSQNPHRSFSPTGEASCVSPSSDDFELHMKHFTTDQKISSGSQAPVSPAAYSDNGDPSKSLADSGNYEDLPSPGLSSGDSVDADRQRKHRYSASSPFHYPDNSLSWETVKEEFHKRVEVLKENHMDEYQELKERHNDRVEQLLNKLSEANLRYFEIRPEYDKIQDKNRELQNALATLKEELKQNQLRQQKVYLQMYLKGQQAAKFEVEEKLNAIPNNSPHSSDPEVEKVISEKLKNIDPLLDNNVVLTLMRQLAQSEEEIQKLKVSHNEMTTEATSRSRSGSTFSILRREQIDPEITLQFLKSAIYYFLTDKENAQGHLRAIESILGYSAVERGNINKHTKL